MNIFVTSPDPVECAMWLDDKRVNKMVLETAQLLCAAIILNGGKSDYKLTHHNHPCAVWARKTNSNFKWLYQHGIALADVYRLAYGKTHACIRVLNNCYNQISIIPDGVATAFANATPYKNSPNTSIYEKYRAYMIDKWWEDENPTWKNRKPPHWYTPLKFDH